MGDLSQFCQCELKDPLMIYLMQYLLLLHQMGLLVILT